MDSASTGSPSSSGSAAGAPAGPAPTGPGPDPAADPATQQFPRPAADGSAGPREWVGQTVRGRSGNTVGRLTDVVDGPDGTPWGVVRPRTGGSRTIPLSGATPDDRGVTVPIDRRTVRTAPDRHEPDAELAQHYTSHGALSAAHEYQHERFGGLKIGSAFFGWLVAVGLTVLLGALASLVVRLAGVSPDLGAGPGQDPRMLGITGGIVAVAVMLLSYYAGGYVSGRLARFDGARNGVAVWAMGLVVTVAVSIAIAVTGATDSLFAALRVPGVAVSGEALTLTGVIALLIAAAVALIGAVVGGKAGERYHRRVDRAAESAFTP
ncbi:PRC-barrel domain-containing protein [Pseudonocardia sp. RS010]|uniref:PRC-barrel domain-containing protein n=1 Tax=Pseudonocardia sp. RS010 TaxID=3385979 RepID=UPI0039A2C933